MTFIPLRSAYLCVNCEAVTDNAIRCNACAGQVLLPIINKLGAISEPAARLLPEAPLRLFRRRNGVLREVRQ